MSVETLSYVAAIGANDDVRLARTDDVVLALRTLPNGATLREVVAAVLGERPVGHGQTYANVDLTQRALARLAEAAAGRAFGAWSPEP
jgi:hypothetical protein